MSKYYLTGEDCLLHSGTKGMKWYHRLYQNPDGTYTELGKLRRRQEYRQTEQYKNDKRIANERRQRAFNQNVKQGKDKPNTSPAGQIAKSTGDIASRTSDIIRRSSKKQGEDLSKYSDSDLQKMVNRMRLEQQYSDLKSDEIKSGARIVSDAIDTIGDIAAIGVSAAMIVSMIKQIKG